MVSATNASRSKKDYAKEEMVGAAVPDDPIECFDVFRVKSFVVISGPMVLFLTIKPNVFDVFKVNSSVILWKWYRIS